MIPWLLACIPFATTWDEVEEFPIRKDPNPSSVDDDPSTLRFMTWNLKYGGARTDFFFDGWGDEAAMSQATVDEHLAGLVALIEEQDPDVLLAQEVDVDSKRSAYVDMVDRILEETAFNYAAYVPVWQVEYIAQDGMGPVDMGMTVFSKYQITRNTRIDLPQSSQSAVVNYFYLHRAIQITELDLMKAGTLTVVNNHPEAYAQDGTKQKHLAMTLDELAQVEGDLVAGGDWNVVPPGTINTDDFDDVAPADTLGVEEVVYSESEIDAFQPFYDLYEPETSLDAFTNAPEAMPPDYDQSYGDSTCEERPKDQRRYFSHSLSKDVFWNQKLDGLFTTLHWIDAAVLQCPGDGAPAVSSEPMRLSDHAPVVAVLELP